MPKQQDHALLLKMVRESLADPESGLASRSPSVEESAAVPQQPLSWTDIVFATEPPFRIAAALVEQENSSSAFEADAAARLLTPLGQVLARVLGAQVTKPVGMTLEKSAAPPEASAAVLQVVLDQEDAFLLCVSEAHLAALNGFSRRPAKSGPSNPVWSALMDVELPISLVLGTRQLPLGEILQLKAGSQIELDNRAGDPVEVIVNNRVVARGNVVAIAGNYGVRISEIFARPELTGLA